MLLKRKRSEDELSSFSSSSPLVPASSGDVTTLDMDVDMDMDQCIDSPLSALTIRSPTRSCTPSHLPSRTFKRLRNGRPSDREVHRKSGDGAAVSPPQGPFLSWGMFPDSLLRHVRASTENTLQMLYRAQQRPLEPQNALSPQPPASSSIPPSPVPAVQPHSPAMSAPAQGQRSLHSFWSLPSSRQPPPEPTLSSFLGPSVEDMVDQPTTCGDCGVELGGEDAAVDDGYGFETYISSCSLCRKAVCFSCSVSNLGEQRRCLVCAGKEDRQKRWVGTDGWASEPMSVY